MMDVSLYKSGYELWNALCVWKNQTRARLDLTMSVCEIRYIKKGLDWNRFDFVRVSCRRTKNGSEWLYTESRLESFWPCYDQRQPKNWNHSVLATGTDQQQTWLLILPTRPSTYGSLALSVSAPLHGLTFPFLSDRNPLWTPVETRPHFFFPKR